MYVPSALEIRDARDPREATALRERDRERERLEESVFQKKIYCYINIIIIDIFLLSYYN